MLSKILSLVFLGTATQAATPEEWKQRTIYQILTDRFARDTYDPNAPCDLHKYCGGTWKGLESKLDYISGMGFDAIWISPIPENKGEDYHGYGALDWFKVNPHFGTEQDLKDLVATAKSKDIWIMLDVVANHVAPVDLDFSEVTPFNNAEYYHSKCQISNWNDPGNVEYCRLANLPDLNQDNEFVRSTLKTWVHDTIQEFGFEGIRVDTVPEVKKQFWGEYSTSAGVYQVGEVFNGNVGYVAQYQGPLTATLNYPMYFNIKSVFNYLQSMYALRTVRNQEKASFEDVTVLGTFLDNHDNARFLNANGNIQLLKSALTFMIFTEGIPIVYYGTEQGFNGGNDPYCRPPMWPSKYNEDTDLYKFISTLVNIRKTNKIWDLEQTERWVLTNLYCFSRGDIFIATTNDVNNDQHLSITYTPYKDGQKVCNLLYSGDCQTIENGALDLVLLKGESKIFVPADTLHLYE